MQLHWIFSYHNYVNLLVIYSTVLQEKTPRGKRKKSERLHILRHIFLYQGNIYNCQNGFYIPCRTMSGDFFVFFITQYIATDRIHCVLQRQDMMRGKTNDKNKSRLCTEDWSFKISSKIKKNVYSLHRRSLTAIHI